MKKMLLFSLTILTFVPALAHAITVGPSKVYTIARPGTSNNDVALGILFQIAFNNQVTAGQNVTVSGTVEREDGIDMRPGRTFTLTSRQTGQIIFSPNAFSAIAPSTGQYSLNSGSFVAPVTPGEYTVTFDAQEVGPYAPQSEYEIRSTTMIPNSVQIVVAAQLPQCSDGNNNDNAQGADINDPQCHSDCNVNNPGSYSPNHDSESVQAGTCPTLQLNGRAAFFKVVKNFFASITARAFAGE